MPLPACGDGMLQRRPAERDEYWVEVPILSWNRRQFVRVSVQGYDTREDTEVLLRALRGLLPQVVG
jgi:hypothetical protein